MNQLNDKTPLAIHNAGEFRKSVEFLKSLAPDREHAAKMFLVCDGRSAQLQHQFGITCLALLVQALAACPEGEIRVNDITSDAESDSVEVCAGDNLIGSITNFHQELDPHGNTTMRLGVVVTLSPYAQLYLDKQNGCQDAADTIEDQAAAS